MKYEYEFHENGNGFPANGDHVIYDDDNGTIKILKVTDSSTIITKQFSANYCYLNGSEAESDIDWDDLSEEEQDQIYQDSHHVSKVIVNNDEYDL